MPEITDIERVLEKVKEAVGDAPIDVYMHTYFSGHKLAGLTEDRVHATVYMDPTKFDFRKASSMNVYDFEKSPEISFHYEEDGMRYYADVKLSDLPQYLPLLQGDVAQQVREFILKKYEQLQPLEPVKSALEGIKQ